MANKFHCIRYAHSGSQISQPSLRGSAPKESESRRWNCSPCFSQRSDREMHTLPMKEASGKYEAWKRCRRPLSLADSLAATGDTQLQLGLVMPLLLNQPHAIWSYNIN